MLGTSNNYPQRTESAFIGEITITYHWAGNFTHWVSISPNFTTSREILIRKNSIVFGIQFTTAAEKIAIDPLIKYMQIYLQLFYATIPLKTYIASYVSSTTS